MFLTLKVKYKRTRVCTAGPAAVHLTTEISLICFVYHNSSDQDLIERSVFGIGCIFSQ